MVSRDAAPIKRHELMMGFFPFLQSQLLTDTYHLRQTVYKTEHRNTSKMTKTFV